MLKRITLLFTLSLALLAPALAHAGFTPRIACCENVDNSSSCSVVPSPADLTSCEFDEIVALCELDIFGPTFCEPVNLQCCQDSSLVVWLDMCKPHEPGMLCSANVVGETVAALDTCCRCDVGEPEPWCVESLDPTCPSGWVSGPITCEP